MGNPEDYDHGWLHLQVCKLLIDLPKATHFHSKTLKPHRYPYRSGTLVKVVMISRFGDVGCTDDLDAEYGYDIRVRPEHLEVAIGHPSAGPTKRISDEKERPASP